MVLEFEGDTEPVSPNFYSPDILPIAIGTSQKSFERQHKIFQLDEEVSEFFRYLIKPLRPELR
jgi:hypothetical protein